MNEARRFAKCRKPVKRIWSLRRRCVLVKRKDVSPEEFEALWNDRKYPPKLLRAREEPYGCGTMMLRAAVFVGPPKPSIESRYRGYPLTNFQRKRLHNSHQYKFFMRRTLRDSRFL